MWSSPDSAGEAGSRCWVRLVSVSVRTACQGRLQMQGKCPDPVFSALCSAENASCKMS